MSVTFLNRIPEARALVLARFSRVITRTGEDIADATKVQMYPGHFLYSGLSRDADLTGPASDAEMARAEAALADSGLPGGTQWEQQTPLKGIVHVATPWAAFAELGTEHMAPRPALTPAIAEQWPDALYRHAADERGAP